MASVLLYPGDVSDLLDVNDVLRAAHDDGADAIRREIEKRKAGGVPLDDGDGEIKEPPPFEPVAALEGARIRCVMLSERARRMFIAREGDAFRAHRDNLTRNASSVELEETISGLFAVRRDFLAACVDRLEFGGTAFDKLDGRALDALERSHVLTPLFQAAGAMQELAPKKAWRSGSQPASTSGGSTVASVHSIDDAIADAMVARSTATVAGSFLLVPGTKQTLAHGGT